MAGRDSLLKLSDKTVAIVGEFSSLTQTILTVLSEQGADVALVGKESPEARRYIEHINDQREIYPHFGRSGVIGVDLNSSFDANDVIGRVVHSFGRLDSLVDTLPTYSMDLRASAGLAEAGIKFLISRPRSRILWLSHHADLARNPALLDELAQLREAMSKEHGTKNLTTNEFSLGVTEEYLLRNAPKSPSIKLAFEEMKKTMPTAKLHDPREIAAWVMFLSSPLSQGLNGQVLKFT